MKSDKLKNMNNKLLPKLRFPEFKNDGEWVEKKLGEIATLFKGKGISKNDILINGKIECIRYGELYTYYQEVIKEVKSKTNLSIDNLVLSKSNDVILPASGETHIDIATAACVIKDNVALGGDLNILRSDENGIFLAYYMNNVKKKEIAKLAQGIAVVHLYTSQLKQLNLNIPTLAEQKKIADCLSSIDYLITTEEKKVEALKNHKKGLMEQLFPQAGETVPKHRFPEFKNDGEWERKRLGEVLNYLQPTNYLVSNTKYKIEYDTPVLTAGKTFLLGYTNETEGIFSANLPTIIFDDFTTAFQFVDFPFKAKSSAMKMLIPTNNNVNIKFVFEIMKTIKFSLAEHKRHWISEYQNEKIPYPKDPKEQNRIANCLSSIDELISAEEKKVEAFKNHKKGLMQQLFPC